eukprot:scaffold255231_cov41-Prasinocladus_malaysianus.AAC.2
MSGQFRDSSNNCEFDNVCDFPGLKDRVPTECATVDESGEIDNAFPLIFNGGKIAQWDENIADGTETPPQAVVVINKRMSELYILYQCGLMPPFVEEVEMLLQTEMGVELSQLKAAKFFSIPLQNVAVEATIPIAMMVCAPIGSPVLRLCCGSMQEDLGLHPRIDYLPSYVATPCSQKLLACQQNALNYSNAKHMDGLDGIIRSDTAAWPGSYPPEAEQLVIQFSASQDPGALKRAEWHKFLGLFFNKVSCSALHPFSPSAMMMSTTLSAKRPTSGVQALMADCLLAVQDLRAEILYRQIEDNFLSMHEAANAIEGNALAEIALLIDMA